MANLRAVNPTATCGAIAGCFALCAGPVRAEISLPNGSLEVHHAASVEPCVGEGELGAKIRAQLSRTAADATLRTISVLIAGDSENLVADVTVVGRNRGVRRIRARQCAGLTDALAVTIALILDPNARAGAIGEVTPEHRHGAPAGPTQEPQNNADRTPAPNHLAPTNAPRASFHARVSQMRTADDSRSRHLEWRAWAGAGAGSWEPWQVESGAAVFFDAWGIELGAFYQPPHDHTVGNGKVRLTTLGGLVAGCLQHGNAWRGTLCVRGAAGAERVRGGGFDRDDTNLLATVSLGPSVGVETGSSLVWGLYLMGQLSVFRDHYVVENSAGTLEAPTAAAWLVARVSLSSGHSGR